MRLICRSCGTVYSDPGGDPRQYCCNVCYHQGLERVATKQEKVLAAGIAGATVGGLAFGPVGALVGGLFGLVVGENQFK
jgi:hypothetical protein